MKAVPPTYYDEEYFSEMAPNNFRHFVESRGRSLLKVRLNNLSLVKLQPGIKLLDAGCGRGELVMFCGSRAVDSYGVDYSETAIRIGSDCLSFYTPDELRNIHLLVADVTSLPFADAYFDRAMSWGVAEHLYQGQFEKCLAEIYRVLKPDGVLVIATQPNQWYARIGYPIIRPFKQAFIQGKLPGREQSSADPRHVNLKNPLSLKSDLRQAGFICKVWLPPRVEYEVKHPLFRFGATILENLPIVSPIFRYFIVAIAAKSRESLGAFLRMPETEFLREGQGIK